METENATTSARKRVTSSFILMCQSSFFAFLLQIFWTGLPLGLALRCLSYGCTFTLNCASVCRHRSIVVSALMNSAVSSGVIACVLDNTPTSSKAFCKISSSRTTAWYCGADPFVSLRASTQSFTRAHIARISPTDPNVIGMSCVLGSGLLC
jgi:hypothetical protein